VDFDEPFKRLFTQGMIIKDGAKMSKSKGNVVSPDALIAKYGADAVRLCTLFIGPPEKDAEWNDKGAEGAWRFLNRVWRLLEQLPKGETKDAKVSDELKRKTHLTIKRVSEDIEQEFHFNTAISAIMELVNEIYKVKDKGAGSEIIKEALEAVVILLSPFVPHIAEEMWQRLGKKNSIFSLSWPVYDEGIIRREEVLVVVQINSKVRAKVTVPRDIEETRLKEIVLQDEKVASWIKGKPVKKFFVVPNKLVNIVL